MKHPFYVLAGSIMLAAPAATLTATPAIPSRPNILFILADDLGWMDVGFQGNRWVETPNLDRLAAQGTVFSQAYAYPLCTPTRAALMTGRHPARLRMTRVFDEFDRGQVEKPGPYHPANRQKPGGWDELSPAISPDLPLSEFTIGELARSAGYRTAFMGKWHLGFGESFPEHQGFDTVFRGDHWSDYFAPYAGERVQGDSVPEEHIADRLATEAIRFIEADKTRPFLLCAWFYDVHTPIEAKRDLVDHYARRLAPESGIHPVYAAMVHSLDENVGRILAALEEQGIADETLVLFMSDNGGLARVGSGAVFDPRDHLNRHPGKSAVDLAACEASLGQSFTAPGTPFELSFSVAPVPADLSTSIRAELLREERDGRWTPVQSRRFSADELRKRSSGSLRVETRAPAAGQRLMLRLHRPPELAADAIRITSTENDSYYGGALHIDDRATAGDLVLRLLPLGQSRPGRVLPDHEIWVVWRGNGEIRAPHGVFRVAPGMIFWYRPGQYYEVAQSPEHPLAMTFLMVQPRHQDGSPAPIEDRRIPDAIDLVDPTLAESVARRIVELQWEAFLDGKSAPAHARGLYPKALITSEEEALPTSPFCPARIIINAVSENCDAPAARISATLLQGFVQEILHQSERDRGSSLNGLEKRQRRIVASLAMKMQDNPREVESINDLAYSVGYSADHFTRTFKKILGCGPQEFLVHARINKAKQMLHESELSVKEIAIQLGYCSVYFFSRQFKAITGGTPTEFRSAGAVERRR